MGSAMPDSRTPGVITGGWAGRSDFLPIFPGHTVPTHFQRVQKRRDAAPEAYLRTGYVVPAHRHFDRTVIQPLRDIEHLDIETESLQQLPLEDLRRRPPLEQLEAALRIPKWQTGHHSHHQVEQLPPGLAKERLMHADE